MTANMPLPESLRTLPDTIDPVELVSTLAVVVRGPLAEYLEASVAGNDAASTFEFNQVADQMIFAADALDAVADLAAILESDRP